MVRDPDATTEPQPFFQCAGRYLLSPAIAAGGMAGVHLARSISAEGFSRTVAIKRMHPHLLSDAELVTMFRDEARMSMRIQHPNVVPVIDVVDQAGELLLVMDYVHGESLVQLLKLAQDAKERLSLDVASAIIGGILHGLHAAHTTTAANGESLEIVHRDVSPHNVLVGVDGVARMSDFGIAKAKGRLRTTQDGLIRGKLAYMAPEQVRGAEVSPRTDVYAAGVLLWESAAGRPLYSGAQEAQLVYEVLEAEAPRLSTLVPGAPDALDELLIRALAKDPAMRFESARAMANALELAVPPASQSVVGAVVERLAKQRLDQRRHVLQAIEREATEVGKRGAGPSGSAAVRAEVPSELSLPAPRAQAKLKPSPFDPGSRKKRTLGPLVFLLLLLVGIGMAVHRWDKVGPIVDNPAAASLEIMCWGDDGAACRRLAEVYELGQDVDRNLPRALMFYEHSCDLGSSDGCVSLAQFIVKQEREPSPEILARQRKLLQGACDANNHAACGTLGRLLLSSSEAPDARSGAELLDTACAQYDYESCATLGVAYLEGKTVKKDTARARTLCQSACDRASLIGCSCIHRLENAEN